MTFKRCEPYMVFRHGEFKQSQSPKMTRVGSIIHRYETAKQKRIRVIETTVKRVAYFGFELDDAEALQFVENNDY